MSERDWDSEASSMGWSPQEKWRGDPEKWVDAKTFVERGENFLPLIKKAKTDLETQLGAERAKSEALRGEVGTLKKTVTDLIEFQAAEVKRQVEAKVATLRAELRQARKEGDDPDRVADLEEALDTAKDELKEATTPKKVATEAPPPPPTVEPWAQAFLAENAKWYGVDKLKTAVFAAQADMLHTQGLRGADLLSAAKEAMEETLGLKKSPVDKSEGGSRGNGSAPSGEPAGKGWKDLPPEAKEQCKKDEAKFVGKGKAFPDAAAWHKHYVDVYFNG